MLLLLVLPYGGKSQGGLEGFTRDERGRPVSLVNIRLEPDGHTAVSDGSGRFGFGKLYAGTYRLEASCVGYETVSLSVRIGTTGHTPLHIVLKEAEAQLDAVEVTAARENPDQVLTSLQAVQVVHSIGREQIEAMGSRRLDEVLREQTGMAIVSDVGSGNRSVGLQLQGFSSEYITILLNGQPVGGRHGGNLDLSRISAHDIERIEIIKGASCSFYGSEALGGTVNIITRQNIRVPSLSGALRWGSYQTTDAAASGETPFASGNGYAHLGISYYRTGGFNVNPYLKEGKTAPPYRNWEANGRSRWQLTPAGYLNVSARYADRYSVMERNYGAMPTADRLAESDFNGMVSWDQYYSRGHRLLARYYATAYSSGQEVRLLTNDRLLQSNNFTEQLHKSEVQHSFAPFRDRVRISSGLGAEWQVTQAEVSGTGGQMLNYFAFSQSNWEVRPGLSAVAGLRYDGNSRFGGRLNPSVGMQYQARPWLRLHASLGTGFKSPTYRQMYQRFTNLSQGYTVLGANNVQEALAEMEAAGDLQQVWAIAGQVKALEPETARSFNLQLSVQPATSLSVTLNTFYNDIRNLITSQPIGLKRNGAQVFSWFNIASLYSRGIEAGGSWTAGRGFTVSAGYQLLDMKDRGVINAIRTGNGDYAWVRGENGLRAAARSDYFGLTNRSRHSGNVQVRYDLKKWEANASLRGQFRGKYGFLDLDNNGYIDRYDIFVRAHLLLNLTLQKAVWQKKLTVQLSADNLLNYTDYLMPNQPGRMIMAGVRFRFQKNQNQ